MAAAQAAAATATRSLEEARSELEAVRVQAAADGQQAAALATDTQAQLQEQQEAARAAADRLAVEAAQQASALAALQAERDTLLADQQQLMQAVAEHQVALEAALAAQGSSRADEAAPPTPAAPSPTPPGLDMIAMLHSQQEALKAQHEATVAVRACGALLAAARSSPHLRATCPHRCPPPALAPHSCRTWRRLRRRRSACCRAS